MLVLIVEDDVLSRKALTCLLRYRDYQVQPVATAEAALQAIHAGAAPQAILIDVDLPGMDGYELAMLLSRLRPQARMVLITAAERDRFPATLQNLTYLRKPLDVERLLRLLQPRRDEPSLDCTCHTTMPMQEQSLPKREQ